MPNLISCRVGMFRSLEEAFKRFPQAGIHAAEVNPPGDGNYTALADLAKRAGITIATVSTHVQLATEESTKEFWKVIDGAASIGVPKIFISVQAPETLPRETAYARLKATAEHAARRQVILCMETHPPFGTNGDVAKATITAVGHPNLRFNFDTANIYYYNQGTDSVSELGKVLDLVASVHLKDTDGGYHSPNFPALGTGVVDFPGVFKLLSARKFTGPYTLEVEGAAIGGLDDDQRLAFLRQCVDHLRKTGLMA